MVHFPATATLRQQALAILLERDPHKKAAGAHGLDLRCALAPDAPIAEPPGIPGRPDRPELFAKLQFKKQSLVSNPGRAALIHSLTHIELNAIEMALQARYGPTLTT